MLEKSEAEARGGDNWTSIAQLVESGHDLATPQCKVGKCPSSRVCEQTGRGGPGQGPGQVALPAWQAWLGASLALSALPRSLPARLSVLPSILGPAPAHPLPISALP